MNTFYDITINNPESRVILSCKQMLDGRTLSDRPTHRAKLYSNKLLSC